MKVYRLLITACIVSVLGSGSALNAQQDLKSSEKQLSPEKQVELKIRAISNELMLNDKTSKSFTSLYKKYIKDLDKSSSSLHKLYIKNNKKGKDFGNYSDKDIEKILKENLKLNEKQLKIHKKYYNKFKDILSMRQIYVLFAPIFNERYSLNERGPIAVDYYNNKKTGRIQDKERVPVVSKKEAILPEKDKK